MPPKVDPEIAVSEPSITEPPRRPYSAPRLRRLGSVRELTLGGSMGASEFAGTYKIISKM